MSDDRVSWFDSQAVKTEHICGPFLLFIFLQFRAKMKKNAVSFIFYLHLFDVQLIWNLVNALRMEANHKTIMICKS